MANELWTIGHSTRTFPDFLEILRSHDIRMLVDVRRYPVSRRHPQFNADALSRALTGSGIEYTALGDLGGRRKPQPNSINLGWRNDSFRGYADYMQTGSFQHALRALLSLASRVRTAILCAEAVPWRCHRSLIADSAVHLDWRVHHILTREKADAHTLCDFAQSDGDRLIYPPADASSKSLRLF